MRPIHAFCIVGLLLASSRAIAGAAEHLGVAGEIVTVSFAGAVGPDGDAAYDVAGKLPPNSMALLLPIVYNGRSTWMFTDAAIEVRANSSGAFFGEIVLPGSFQLKSLVLMGMDGKLIDILNLSIASEPRPLAPPR